MSGCWWLDEPYRDWEPFGVEAMSADEVVRFLAAGNDPPEWLFFGTSLYRFDAEKMRYEPVPRDKWQRPCECDQCKKEDDDDEPVA